MSHVTPLEQIEYSKNKNKYAPVICHMHVLVCSFSYVFISLFFILHMLCVGMEINYFDSLKLLREDNHK